MIFAYLSNVHKHVLQPDATQHISMTTCFHDHMSGYGLGGLQSVPSLQHLILTAFLRWPLDTLVSSPQNSCYLNGSSWWSDRSPFWWHCMFESNSLQFGPYLPPAPSCFAEDSISKSFWISIPNQLYQLEYIVYSYKEKNITYFSSTYSVNSYITYHHLNPPSCTHVAPLDLRPTASPAGPRKGQSSRPRMPKCTLKGWKSPRVMEFFFALLNIPKKKSDKRIHLQKPSEFRGDISFETPST